MLSSLLLTGPPASGKSRAALDRFLTIPNSILLTPTSTMAEHLRHELARAGVAVRPRHIDTLAGFVDEWAATPAAPKPLVHLLIQEALERLRLPRLAGVAQFRGFHAAVAAVLEELPFTVDVGPAVLPSAGLRSPLESGLAARTGGPTRIETGPTGLGGPTRPEIDARSGGPAFSDIGGSFGVELTELRGEVEAGLAARGLELRNSRLRSAARRVREADAVAFEHVVLDGFFTFSPQELDLIEALAMRAAITVTLPDCPGAMTGREQLLGLGFGEQRFDSVHRQPQRDAFSAPTLDREAEEIARRILAQVARGRRFREIGVILRTRDPYQPALEATFARFGIPSRAYFLDSLESHPAVRFFAGVVRALLGGWDHAELLALVRMPLSGVGATSAGDAFDFDLRESLPGAGLPLRGIENPPAILDRLAGLNDWRTARATASEWSLRLQALPKTLGIAVDRDVRKAWSDAMDVAAAAFSEIEPMALERFWRQAELGLALAELRVTDRRRDVVHVMDAYEGRQWELPVVFVCGMVERHFPQYHREDPLLSDAARRRAGMRTSEDRQLEEKLLFELAMTRATEQTVLSYARFNEKGEETLRSFFLESEAPECDIRIRPRPSHPSPATPRPFIQDEALRANITAKHIALSPTSLESFLQCPFQFFGRKTLRLRLRPPAPRDRLDVLLQGSILHRALAELSGAPPLLGVELLNQIFDQECVKKRVPWSYRAEAVRLELLRNFEAFLKDHTLDLPWEARVEQKFEFALSPELAIRGRIDVLRIGPERQALVVDYKYSPAQRIRKHVQGTEAGDLVQAGLYLLAAERFFELEPVGMLYCGVRDPVTWDGWHAGIAGLEKVGENCTPVALRELTSAAARAAVDALQEIASGNIEPKPRDTDKCKWCDFRDICRVGEGGAARRAGGGAQE